MSAVSVGIIGSDPRGLVCHPELGGLILTPSWRTLTVAGPPEEAAVSKSPTKGGLRMSSVSEVRLAPGFLPLIGALFWKGTA